MRRFERKACFLSIVLSFAALGCSSDPASEGGGPDDDAPAGPITFMRFDLFGSHASASLTRSSIATIAPEQVPVPALAGELMAVAYDGDTVLEAVPVAFPTTATKEGKDAAGEPFEEDLALDEATATVWLHAASRVDRVVVMDVAGNTLVEIEDDALPKAQAASMRGGLGQAEAALVEDGIALDFPGIQFLSPGEEALLPKVLQNEIEAVVLLDLSMDEPLTEALNAIAPKARGAMSTVAVVKMKETNDGLTTLGIASGQAFILNADIFQETGEVTRTVVHENAHNYTYVLNAAVANGSELSAWPSDVQEAAKKTIEGFRLAGGITQVMGDLQSTAVSLGLGLDYQGANWTKLSDSAANDGGFATHYGSKKANEDIAEYTQRVQAPDAAMTALCAAIRDAKSPFPEALVLPYAKMKLLSSLGFIEPNRLEACIGDPPVEGSAGIHLGDVIDFEDNLQAGWLDQDGGHFLAVLGEGPNTYGFLLRVLAEDEQPLGLHRLDSISLGNIHSPNNAVYLKNDNPDKARASGGGLVLVTAANAARIEGAMFFLSLQNGLGQTTDAFALSTFLVE